MCEIEQHRTLSNTLETKEMQTSIQANDENKKQNKQQQQIMHDETTNRAKKEIGNH
jgi:hypothetical protein